MFVRFCPILTIRTVHFVLPTDCGLLLLFVTLNLVGIMMQSLPHQQGIHFICIHFSGLQNSTNVSSTLSVLENSSWLKHIHLLLEAAVFIAKVSDCKNNCSHLYLREGIFYVSTLYCGSVVYHYLDQYIMLGNALWRYQCSSALFWWLGQNLTNMWPYLPHPWSILSHSTWLHGQQHFYLINVQFIAIIIIGFDWERLVVIRS